MQSIMSRFRSGEPTSASLRRRRIDLGTENPGYPIYAIGDIHGCLDDLYSAEERIVRDMEANGLTGMVVFLGDYLDRGPKSRSVLDHLIALRDARFRYVALCGNHEATFLNFFRSPEKSTQWLEFGGVQTLMSYGIDCERLLEKGQPDFKALRQAMQRAIPATHIELLEQLPLSLKVGHYLFVHAGVRPGIPFDEQKDDDLIWIREPFLRDGPQLPFVVIHGHTPVSEPDFGNGRIGIDTGACFGGKLTVLKIHEGQARVI